MPAHNLMISITMVKIINKVILQLTMVKIINKVILQLTMVKIINKVILQLTMVKIINKVILLQLALFLSYLLDMEHDRISKISEWKQHSADDIPTNY